MRLMSIATQKFIADIATDAFQYCKIRQQTDSDKNIQDDPHSKIIEILRESSASSPSQTTDSQVKYARQFMEGELYSPQDLDEESYKTKRVGRFIRKTPNVDVFTKLNLDPLVEYKVINKNKYFYEIEID
ncbi:4758_t:CDS:2 [Entrophospora sp. SA101]|nr:4758_t:CDS:2 [Entrophospora sp. SA101]